MKIYVPYQVPPDVDQRVTELQRQLAAARGVEQHRVSKSGDVLRHLFAIADAAEQMNIKPITEACTQ
jgi:hypothetical protein